MPVDNLSKVQYYEDEIEYAFQTNLYRFTIWVNVSTSCRKKLSISFSVVIHRKTGGYFLGWIFLFTKVFITGRFAVFDTMKNSEREVDQVQDFVIKGDLCYSKSLDTVETVKDGYLVCVGGRSAGVYSQLPQQYDQLPITDYSDKLVIPGLVDLHVHGPQFAFRGMGMDLELLQWLETHTFPEEAKYRDIEYAQKAYALFVEELRIGPNTRACIFATIHTEATRCLMDLLENTGIVAMVGKVNMDRNSPDYLREQSPQQSAEDTLAWLESCQGNYKTVSPILTPRFIPTCSEELLKNLGEIQRRTNLPVQSHLSENPGEIAWVKELCPHSSCYGDAYNKHGLFGGDVPTIMAHCVWPTPEELALMVKNKVYVAHCPQSNSNLSSGIAPVRRLLEAGVPVGLGSDIAGGSHLSILRVMGDAIQCSKLYWRLVDQQVAPLTIQEAFYLATLGGGSFFGQVGSFEAGYEFDAVVLEDGKIPTTLTLSILERLERAVYLSDDRHISAKYVRGALVK